MQQFPVTVPVTVLSLHPRVFLFALTIKLTVTYKHNNVTNILYAEFKGCAEIKQRCSESLESPLIHSKDITQREEIFHGLN